MGAGTAGGLRITDSSRRRRPRTSGTRFTLPTVEEAGSVAPAAPGQGGQEPARILVVDGDPQRLWKAGASDYLAARIRATLR